jgi:hypothetical protein
LSDLLIVLLVLVKQICGRSSQDLSRDLSAIDFGSERWTFIICGGSVEHSGLIEADKPHPSNEEAYHHYPND